jgi:hypothetical protein
LSGMEEPSRFHGNGMLVECIVSKYDSTVYAEIMIWRQ